MSAANVAVVGECLDAWNRADYDAWARRAHPDVEYFSAITRLTAGHDTAFSGAEEMRRFWEEWHALWDLRIDITSIRDLGEKVLALGSITTRGKASGVELCSPVGCIFEFDEDLFRWVTTYLDRGEALTAAGAE